MQDAKVQHQELLETLFSKNQLIPRLRKEFSDFGEVDIQAYLKQCEIPYAFGIDVLVQMALHKRANVPTMVGCLRHHCDSAQDCADLLLKCAEADLMDWWPDLKVFVVKFDITEDVQQELDRYQFPLPMVVEPKEVEDNRDTGYMLTHGSLILRDNHHNGDICLDHINRVNKVRFTINTVTATMVQNQWRNLDKPKEGESREDFAKRKRAFEKYDRTAHDVIGLLTQEGNEFYLTHKYDKRGRIYCQGYHVNYQGTAWNKAVVEFTDKEPLV